MQDQIRYYEEKLKHEMDPSDLFSALEKQDNIVVIDARQDFGYDKEHIPTAINLPHRSMDASRTAHLDKSMIYVCYCDGIGCNASTKGALNLAKLGFQVKELIGGLQWWKFDGYATVGTESEEGLEINCAC